MEDKLQKLLVSLPKDEQSLMKLDSIFKALGVDTFEDIERLVSFFVRDSNESIEDKAKSVHEDRAQLIHPNEVIAAIKRFADESRLEVIKQREKYAQLGIGNAEENGIPDFM